MLTEILSGVFLTILAGLAVLAIVIVALVLTASGKSLVDGFFQALENKQERQSIFEIVIGLGILLLLCKYV
jgi:hypothetical protein